MKQIFHNIKTLTHLKLIFHSIRAPVYLGPCGRKQPLLFAIRQSCCHAEAKLNFRDAFRGYTGRVLITKHHVAWFDLGRLFFSPIPATDRKINGIIKKWVHPNSAWWTNESIGFIYGIVGNLTEAASVQSPTPTKITVIESAITEFLYTPSRQPLTSLLSPSSLLITQSQRWASWDLWVSCEFHLKEEVFQCQENTCGYTIITMMVCLFPGLSISGERVPTIQHLPASRTLKHSSRVEDFFLLSNLSPFLDHIIPNLAGVTIISIINSLEITCLLGLCWHQVSVLVHVTESMWTKASRPWGLQNVRFLAG